jgi:hypothetical protein
MTFKPKYIEISYCKNIIKHTIQNSGYVQFHPSNEFETP